MSKKEKVIDINSLVDKSLIYKIQPQGGLSFKDEKFIKTGAGYECCIHIYQYPKYLDTYWLATVMNINNVVAVLDISTEDTNEVKKNINKSMKEQNARYKSATDVTDQTDAENKYNELDEMYREISSMGEVVKLIHLRLFVSAKTIEEIDKETKNIINYLESNGYKSAIFLNETKAEWQAMYQSYTEQQDTQYRRYGQPILSDTLAGGNPFHFSSLIDKNGTYLGYTNTGGSVLFDLYSITNRRKSYNALAIGTMGAGKSTTIKKITFDRAIKGDFIRGFDVADEYKEMCNTLGGTVISLDGSAGILNALEILKTDDNEMICFNRHLSKLSTVYRFLLPTVDDYEVIEYETCLKQFYQSLGFNYNEDTQFTGLPPTAYPIWSDFLVYIDKVMKTAKAKGEIQTELEITRMKRLNNIRLVISNLVESYGHIFNGHTSIQNVLDTQIVIFDIKNLASMKSEIFDAQIFLALSLCWDNCVQIGKKMKQLYDTKKIKWEDITRFLIFIDEAHKIINTNKLQAVEQLTIFSREARKFFGGLLFASQSIRDFVPEGSNQNSIDKIKTLFELTQYKFIMQQDSNSLDILNKVFQYQLTESELTQIPRLEKGECILSISSDRNIQFKIDVSDEELEIFRGGA